MTRISVTTYQKSLFFTRLCYSRFPCIIYFSYLGITNFLDFPGDFKESKENMQVRMLALGTGAQK